MKILINLIGEQPIPNLLPILHLKPDKTIVLHTHKTHVVAERLKKIIGIIQLVRTEPYSFTNNLKKLQAVFNNNDEYIFNITGGTKIMSVALFQFALETNSKVVYVDSQNNKNNLIYVLENNQAISERVEKIKEMIDIKTYLNVHLDGYFISKNQDQNIEGIKYENSIVKVLERNGFEVVQSVKPKGEGDQLEIDAVLKLKGTNNFAIAEIKSGYSNESAKKGIDQLSTAGSREYLGIYTKKILVSRRRVNDSVKKLADKHNVIVVDRIYSDREFNIKETSKNILIGKLKNILKQ